MTANSSSCEFLQRFLARGGAHQPLVERIEDCLERQQIRRAVIHQQDAGLHSCASWYSLRTRCLLQCFHFGNPNLITFAMLEIVHRPLTLRFLLTPMPGVVILRPDSNQFDQLPVVDRLGQVIRRARRHAAIAIFLQRLGGHRDHRQPALGRIRAYQAHRFVAVHLRHHDVDECDVDFRMTLEHHDSSAAVFRVQRLHPMPFEQGPDGENVARIVVDDQHGLALEAVERFTREPRQRRLRGQEITHRAGRLRHFFFDLIDQPRLRLGVVLARPEQFDVLAVADGHVEREGAAFAGSALDVNFAAECARDLAAD